MVGVHFHFGTLSVSSMGTMLQEQERRLRLKSILNEDVYFRPKLNGVNSSKGEIILRI